MNRAPEMPALAPFGTTVFSTMSALAARYDAVNLGQGYPDTDGPDEVLAAAIDAIQRGDNQYPPGPGTLELRTAVAEHQQRFYGITLDPECQVLVTSGASGALSSAVLALCQHGDEVVMFEPYYDLYAAAVAMSGAARRTVPLRFPDFELDEEALRAAFSPHTRLVVLNAPHNPTGKVFTREELEVIAALAIEHDAWVLADEVYEHLVFDDTTHVPIATLPGMAERTITVSSAGKTFSATGWRIGWATGPAEAIAAMRSVKQYLTYVEPGPFQHAAAIGLRLPDSVFNDLAASLASQRDLLVDGLRSLGLPTADPKSGYFAIADASPLGATDAAAWCEKLPERAGVAAIPVSAFLDDVDSGRSLVRFAFCKRPEVLTEGLERLRRYADAQQE